MIRIGLYFDSERLVPLRELFWITHEAFHIGECSRNVTNAGLFSVEACNAARMP